MVIKLYKTSDDPKKVDKVLTDELSINGIAREPVNLVDPIIEIDGDNLAILGYNYAYIEDFNRYYFINPTADSYNLNTLSLHCDALKTAAPWLRQRSATLTRSEQWFNGYLNDAEFNALAYRNIVVKNFPTGVTGDSIILMTVG